MEFKKILPSNSLKPYVRNYWLFDINMDDIPFSQLLFPFGSFELIINLLNAPQMSVMADQSCFLQPHSLFPGQFTKPFVLNFTQPTKCIGISLQPWMGKLLFNIPAQEFTNKVIPVEHIDSNLRLRDKLLGAKNEEELIAQLELHLLLKLKSHQTDTTSLIIAKAIINNPTSTSGFKNIVSSIGFSRRRIEQRFLEATGLPIGHFFRKVRFQKAVNLLRYKSNLPLTGIGLEAGYYDQAHFIREFKLFTGITPSQFIKQTSGMTNFVSELITVG
jgi:AraC-like DNA-binding protein